MIVQRVTHVKLRKQYTKILYLCQATNRTFVFLGMQGTMGDCIVHVDRYGHEKFFHKFGRPIDSLIMMSQFQAVLLQTRANVITILDLNTHQFKRIPHYFMNEESDQSFLWSFPQTKYMAVIEHGRYNDNRIKITYFNYPQTNPEEVEGKPLIYHRKQLLEHEFKDDEGKWNFQYQIVKGNNHSMVLWFKARHDHTFEFRFYRRNKDMQLPSYNNSDVQSAWEYKEILIDHKLQILYNFKQLQIAVLQAFELEKDRLFVNCLSNRDPSRQQKSVTGNYVVDLTAKTVNQTPHNLGKYQSFQIDHMLLGSCHMIRTFEYKKGEVQETPVIYYSNSTFQPIFKETWKCTSRTKYFFPGYDSYIMLQNEYENGGKITQFTCRYKKLIEYKEILLFFMLEINEDFDDDLMQDAVQLICDK